MAAAAAAVMNGDLLSLDETFNKVLVSRPNSANDLAESTAESGKKPISKTIADRKLSESRNGAAQEGAAILEGLLSFRDRYFESHPIHRATRKKDDVSVEIENALIKLERLNDQLSEIGCQALYLTLRGRINNANQSYSEEAFLDLSKAIKLDPRQGDAWNALGECYWYKGDMEEARNCFEGSLKHAKNKAALRNLSIVMRQLLPPKQEDKFVVIRESVDKAKEAVSLDTNDGMSWYVLGTAYLSLFFISNQNPKVLRQCLSAYSQAEKDPSVKNLPDLHYNRAMAFKHMEEYKNAITGFHTALCLEPDWNEAQKVRDDILIFLKTIQEHVKTRGKIKGKKLTSFVNSINPKVALGPFAGGSYSSSISDGSSNKKEVTLTHVPISELSPGDNANKVVVGKVTSSVTSECITAFAFTMVDSDKNCVAVTLYNLKAGIGVIIGDTVAIAEPFMERIDFNFDPEDVRVDGGGGEGGGRAVESKNSTDSPTTAEKPRSSSPFSACSSSVGATKFEFVSLRVPTPVVVVVNGKKWGRDKEAFTEMRVSVQPTNS